MRLVCAELLAARKERAEAVSLLRQVCDRFGDNDWPDNLHIYDIIEKHLWDNLEDAAAEKEDA